MSETPPPWMDHGDEAERADQGQIESRVPPHDLDVEACVLSAVIVDPEAYAKVRGILRAEHFYSEAHRRIFEAAAEVDASGQPIDYRTVAAWLRDHNRLSQVGGHPYLTQTLNATPAVANVAAHAKIVVDKWRAREAILLGQKLAALGYANTDPRALVASAVADLAKLQAPEPAAPWQALVTSVDPAWTEIAPPTREWLLRDTRRPNRDGVLPQGKAGQLVAEGGIGKTMAIMQLAIAKATGADWLGTFATGAPGPVLVLLGEEDREEVKRRIYAAARLADRALPVDSIVALPLFGVECALLQRDQAGNTCETAFCIWLREFIRRRQWSLIIIDPLSRFAGPDTETSNAEGTRFVQLVESFAMSTGATVLVAHHVNAISRGPGATVRAGRGVTSLYDGFRWAASLTSTDVDLDGQEERDRLAEVVTLRAVKSNYSRKFEPLVLRRVEGGPFVPLDTADLEIVSEARGKDPERDAKKAARAVATETAKRAENDRDDDAARAIMAAHPGALVGELCALFRKARACGQTRAHAALTRVRKGA